jgi:hypothetical protein
MTALANHLWQSLLCFALVCALAALTRAHSARARVWLWRLAALKWLLPFALLSGIGAWLGFPVRYAGDPPPPSLVRLIDAAAPWLQPGAWLGSLAQWLAPLALFIASFAALRVSLGHIHTEALRARVEELRLERDPDDREPSVGFLRAALMTACAIMLAAMPMLGGAVRASVHDHEVLEANLQSMRDARVTLRPARPGLGSRYFVRTTARGVVIRNITLRELTALSYGVNRFFVRGDHFREAGEEDWLVDSRHDVTVEAPVIEPERFDTYALRPAITRELAKNFGLEIYVNNACQPPCGKWGDRVLVEISPGRWALVDPGAAPVAGQQHAADAAEPPALK